jgi:hypothetical protein
MATAKENEAINFSEPFGRRKGELILIQNYLLF